MRVEVADQPLSEVKADFLAVLIFAGDELPEPLAGAPGSEDVKATYKRATLVHPRTPRRALVVGLGGRDDFEPERARVAAAIAARTAASMDASSLALKGPDGDDAAVAATAMVEGAILASYRFDRFKSKEDEGEGDSKPLEDLTMVGDGGLAEAVEAARIGAEAENFARELQDLPSNVVTPSYLAGRANAIAEEHGSVTCEVLGRDEIKEKGMGGLVAVSQGTAEEPRLIVLRYQGGSGETLGLVGKGVTFDSGGISIKPAASMHEMKMDMSGAAAVLETVSALAKLEVPIDVLAVIPSTENMPSGTAVKPGDIITQLNGKTVEINNTDAEGRLILADALAYAVELGADRIVDLATLTGAVLVALGSTYAGMISNDDALATEVEAAAARTGELAWRLPLHPEYKDLTKGTAADLTNASAKRKASTIYAGSFLEEFVDGKPWVHLDIAGTAWDVGREYVGKGPTGYGVRLLVELARSLSDGK
ncbi:MAG TPA: leucyl aminopeptidase [Solirubrobacterales bacterium]|nr:leucyl aminopeptidase [Solirubrobacterales bacterium]